MIRDSISGFTREKATGFTARIAWGDGTANDGQIVPNADGTYCVVGSHTYLHRGNYAVVFRNTSGLVHATMLGLNRVMIDVSPALTPFTWPSDVTSSPAYPCKADTGRRVREPLFRDLRR